jgi:phosphoglycerate dehydrogenase-like enzyme
VKLLIAVYPPYLDQFVGEEQFAPIVPMFRDVRRVNPNDLNDDTWRSTFAVFQPDAVLTCWGTPPIPESALPKLRYVAHLSGGVRGLVSRSMIERGLFVTNWGAIHAQPVAEHALLLILSCLRKTTRWTRWMDEHHGWPPDALHEVHSLYGRRVGLHGFGAVARALLPLLKPFGCTISGYSAGVPAEVFETNAVRQAESLEALFADSDVLVEVEALTPLTQGSVTESILLRLPEGAVFVNVGRGAVVDEAALIRIAQEGRLQVGLDVLVIEPPQMGSPLYDLPNVMLTPHIAGPTVDQRPLSGAMAMENLRRFTAGETLLNVISLDAYDRAT